MVETVQPAAVTVCFSGGSGIAYGLRLVEALLSSEITVHLAWTPAALKVLEHEHGTPLDAAAPDWAGLWPEPLRPGLQVHAPSAVEAAPSSGSAGIGATVVCPCSMGTLARVAHGFSSNLVERSADVALKEGRPLILVPRETPLSPVHLRNMLTVAEAGAVVLPASPGFYHRPEAVADMVDFVVGKVLDRLGIDHALFRRWRTPEPRPSNPWDEGEEGPAP